MRLSLVSCAAVVFLAACGGGGGGGGEVAPPVSTTLAITAANYQAVAQESVSSALYVVNTTQFVTGAQLGSDRAVLDFARAQLAKLPRWFGATTPHVTGADIVQIEPCSGGGELRVTLNDINNNQDIDAGESAIIVGSQCVEAGATVNGTMTMLVRTLSGDPAGDVYQMGVTMTLTNLSVAMSGASAVGNGSIGIDVSMTGPNAGQVQFSLDNLNLAASYGNVAYTRSMKDFRFAETRSPEGFAYRSSMQVSGTLTSSALESKSVTLSTPSPLVTLAGQDYPSSGQVIVSGAAGSKVRLTPQNASTVRIEVDADGDGSYEAAISKAWSDLS